MKKLTFVKFRCEDDNLGDVYFVGKSLAKIMSDTKGYGLINIYHEIHIKIDDLGSFCIRFKLLQKPKKVSMKEIRAVAPKELAEAIRNMRSGIYSSCLINTPKGLQERGTTKVCINGWSRDRVLIYRRDHIRLQVTLSDCSNCSACIKRYKELREFLDTKANVKYSFEYNEGTVWLVLKRKPMENPLTILRNVLKIKVEPVKY